MCGVQSSAPAEAIQCANMELGHHAMQDTCIYHYLSPVLVLA